MHCGNERIFSSTPNASGGHSFETFGVICTGFDKVLDDTCMGRFFIDFCTKCCVPLHTWKYRSKHDCFHTWTRRTNIKVTWIEARLEMHALLYDVRRVLIWTHFCTRHAFSIGLRNLTTTVLVLDARRHKSHHGQQWFVVLDSPSRSSGLEPLLSDRRTKYIYPSRDDCYLCNDLACFEYAR